MRLITKREQYATLAERFATMPGTDLKMSHHRDVYATLIRMGGDPDPKVVDALLDNTLGTKSQAAQLLAVPPCSVCNKRLEQVVELKNHFMPVQTFHLCGDCLIKALNLTEENC